MSGLKILSFFLSMFPRCVYSGAFPDFLEYELGSIHISTNSYFLYIHVSILSICFIYTPCISIVLWHSHISVLRYLFLHTSRFYFYILVHFLLYDSGSINKLQLCRVPATQGLRPDWWSYDDQKTIYDIWSFLYCKIMIIMFI